MYRVHIMQERQKWSEHRCQLEKRDKVSGNTSHIPNMLLSLALPQRFNGDVMGPVQCLSLNLTDYGFARASFPFFYISFYSVLYENPDGTFLYSR